MIGIRKFKSEVRDPDHTILGLFVIPRLVLAKTYQCTKFED